MQTFLSAFINLRIASKYWMPTLFISWRKYKLSLTAVLFLMLPGFLYHRCFLLSPEMYSFVSLKITTNLLPYMQKMVDMSSVPLTQGQPGNNYQ